MSPKVYLFGAFFVISLLHPHLAEKWTWLLEVVRGDITWGQRFRPIDTFDLFLHTGMSVVFLTFALQAWRQGA